MTRIGATRRRRQSPRTFVWNRARDLPLNTWSPNLPALLTLGCRRPGIKLPAEGMILYPASTLHRVAPVTRGSRVASFFWTQSMVRLDADRAMLFELDTAIQALAAKLGSADSALVRLTGVYHNLLRRHADV